MINLLNVQAFANSFTVVGLGVYVVCRVLSLIAPELLFSIGRSWFHTINLDVVRTVAPMDMGTFILGAVSTFVFVWVSAYSAASLYNSWAKKG